VRPQDLVVLTDEASASELRIEGTVSVVEPLGSEAFVHVEAGELTCLARAASKALPQVGTRVRLGAKAENLHLFDRLTEKAV